MTDKNISDFYGVRYSEHKDVQVTLGEELLEKCTFYDGQKILDVGCNDGYFSFIMARKAKVEVDAFDISEEAISIAVKRKSQENIDNVNFILDSAKTYKKEGHYDLIFSNFVFHWFADDHDVCVKNIYDSLKCGGKLVASLSGSTYSKDGKKISTYYELAENDSSIINRAIDKLNYKIYFKGVGSPHKCWAPTEKEIYEELEDVGFKQIKVICKMEESLKQAEYPSLDRAYENILATELSSYYLYLPSEKEEAILYNECLNMCKKEKPEHITAVDLYLEAER